MEMFKCAKVITSLTEYCNTEMQIPKRKDDERIGDKCSPDELRNKRKEKQSQK
jgi:hypothetical protein